MASSSAEWSARRPPRNFVSGQTWTMWDITTQTQRIVDQAWWFAVLKPFNRTNRRRGRSKLGTQTVGSAMQWGNDLFILLPGTGPGASSIAYQSRNRSQAAAVYHYTIEYRWDYSMSWRSLPPPPPAFITPFSLSAQSGMGNNVLVCL